MIIADRIMATDPEADCDMFNDPADVFGTKFRHSEQVRSLAQRTFNSGFFARFKKTPGQKNSKNLCPQKNSRAILNKKLSVLESTWDFH